ncbi:MAG TPA: hypothetical protein P5048_03440 [Chlamydiales bacterium]|mgnify:CR=1 FL=1|nr:hypothetical protein [Chlamydiales bacterium]
MMTMIFSRIFSIYFLTIGLAMLLNSKKFKEMYAKICQNGSFCFIGGVLSLFIGAVIISIHNNWMGLWSTIISLIGWIAIIKGFWLLSGYKCEKIFQYFAAKSHKFFIFFGICAILIGLFLGLHGWRFYY